MLREKGTDAEEAEIDRLHLIVDHGRRAIRLGTKDHSSDRREYFAT